MVLDDNSRLSLRKRDARHLNSKVAHVGVDRAGDLDSAGAALSLQGCRPRFGAAGDGGLAWDGEGHGAGLDPGWNAYGRGREVSLRKLIRLQVDRADEEIALVDLVVRVLVLALQGCEVGREGEAAGLETLYRCLNPPDARDLAR